MKKLFKRTLSVALSAVMAYGAMSFAFTANAADITNQSAAAASYGLPDKIEDGAILHCWTWSFNNIKQNLPKIAAAGFKSIQTSPINAVWKGDGGKMSLKSSGKGNWWYQYQPTDYTIGNYQLGTKEEFTAMCEEAHKYGIKVIVDIVANHCASNYSVISLNVKNVGGKAFHDRLEISDWTNRQQVTQGKLTGLYDLNTQNPKVQQMIVDYMAEVRAAGADGFRYDAAKHIELPDDDASYAGNFWPTILNNDAEFQYGEILTGADRAADYANLMKITADAYGSNLRAALSKKKVTSTTIKNYRLTDVTADRLVTWVESHDNYTTDDVPANNQYSSWYTLNNQKIRQGWSLIASQGDTTPLFFARPQGSGERIEGGTDAENFTQKWGANTIGLDGDGNYFNAEVAEVNKFRNAMVGEGKNTVDVIRQTVTMVERGNKGAVLVNISDNEQNISVKTNVADGEYSDHVSGDTFTVQDGTLTGKIKAGATVVLYTAAEEPGEERWLGDVDHDDAVTVKDVTMVQRHTSEFKNTDGTPLIDETNEKEFKIADVNGDNVISIKDVTAIQRIVAEFDEPTKIVV